MCNEGSPNSPKNAFPPQKLTAAEIANPHQVIYELFDFAHLPRIRELLWEFFKTAVTGNYSHDLRRRERELLVTVYEKIEKLVEAAHVIHEKQKELKKPVFERTHFQRKTSMPLTWPKLPKLTSLRPY
jgi:hypothetical protein